MTLGCGGYGGNITSDNISPRHLLNIKRLAYELTPAVRTGAGVPAGDAAAAGRGAPLPSAPSRPPAPAGISAEALTRRIDEFLGSRGFARATETRAQTRPSGQNGAPPLEFVCEEDVRLAIRSGRQLVISERAIVTPAARDLGEQHRVFSVAPWRG
jgi:acetaldehyde dehydrogenase (acetylating)